MTTLPRSIIKKILLNRADLWLSELCKSLDLNKQQLKEFLISNESICFGSFVTSCLLNTKNYDDIDFMVPHQKMNNHQVRSAFVKISNNSEIRYELSYYCPRVICSKCARFNEDEKLFTYHRQHFDKKRELSFDIIESKNIQQHLLNNTFNIGLIHYDGNQFQMGDIDIVSFVCNPSFKIISITKGINFEFFYDPWSFDCRKEEDGGDLMAKYEYFQDSNSYQTPFPKIIKQIKLVKSIWSDNLNCFSWLNLSDLERPIIELMKLCFRNFRRDKMTHLTTFYKVTRLCLRLLKNCFREIKCLNVREFFY